MLTTTLAAAAVAAEKAPKLPASPAVIGLSTLAFFATLLAILWAFRNVARKH